MLAYLSQLMRYMQENGIEDFKNPGIEYQTINNIVKAIRQIVLNREATPLCIEYENDECQDFGDVWIGEIDYEDYELDIPGQIKVKCCIEYLTPKRSRLFHTQDLAATRMRVFSEIKEINAYDKMGIPVKIFDEEAFTVLLGQELRVVYKGESVQKPQLQYVSDFSDGLAVVCYNQKNIKFEEYIDHKNDETNKITTTDTKTWYTYVNRHGEYAFPGKWYSGAGVFVNGAAKVIADGKEYFIDCTGKEIANPEDHLGVKAINSMSNYWTHYKVDDFGDYTAIREFDRTLGWMGNGEDLEIRCVVTADGTRYPLQEEFEDRFKFFIDDCSEELMILLGNEPDLMLNPYEEAIEATGCCIDIHGKLKYYYNPCKKIPIFGYSEGYAVFHDFGWWYKPEKDPHYDPDFDGGDPDAYPRFRGYSYVNTEGNVAFEGMQFDEAYPFKEGLARVNIRGKWLFIDHEGRVVF